MPKVTSGCQQAAECSAARSDSRQEMRPHLESVQRPPDRKSIKGDCTATRTKGCPNKPYSHTSMRGSSVEGKGVPETEYWPRLSSCAKTLCQAHAMERRAAEETCSQSIAAKVGGARATCPAASAPAHETALQLACRRASAMACQQALGDNANQVCLARRASECVRRAHLHFLGAVSVLQVSCRCMSRHDTLQVLALFSRWRSGWSGPSMRRMVVHFLVEDVQWRLGFENLPQKKLP